MQFSNLFDEDRAVSPVIGVILMVAITVILAAVIGTFVLGLGDQVQDTTPRASFGFDSSNSAANMTISHESGDTITSSNLNITATKDFNNSALGSATDSASWSALGAGSEVSAGTSVEVWTSSGDFNGETFRVIYDNPDSDGSATLGKHEVN